MYDLALYYYIYLSQHILTSTAIPLMMSLIKHGKMKQIFHDAGIKRVSPNIIIALDRAIEDAILRIAQNCRAVYPDRLLETQDIIKLCEVQGGWTLIIDKEHADVLDLDMLVKEIALPDDLDDDIRQED